MSVAVEDVRLYTGHSMSGTFMFGDRLFIESVPLSDIRVGDVVVYHLVKNEGESEELVHRVVKALPNGLVVRGDNNLSEDKILINEEILGGRVTQIERMGKMRPVRNGRLGLMHARMIHVCFFLGRVSKIFLRSLGGDFYRYVRRTGLVARFWQPSVIKLRLLTKNGPELKYIYNNRTVAVYNETGRRTLFRKPFDLVFWKRCRGYGTPDSPSGEHHLLDSGM